MKYPKNPETAHNHTEIIYCREGDGTFFVEQEAFPVHAGDVIYVPAGTLHSDAATTVRWNGHLNVDPNPTLPDHFVIFQDKEQQFFQLFDMLVRAQLRPEPEEQAFANAVFSSILVLLQKWSVGEVQTSNASVDAINQQIMNNFSNVDFDLAAEIAKTGYSAGYFRQLFRGIVGRPPQAQLNYVRLEYAKQQMHIQHTDVSIKTISSNAGFRDPYYFSRLFKQYEGVSPKQYFNLVRDQ